ncbi:uncharacterized protein [Euphorbia lathyris]|uniref:uncharacterized protein n=1 Tax=Euphorbia lathyris TaxID=212925 RepID=UPI003313C82B
MSLMSRMRALPLKTRNPFFNNSIYRSLSSSPSTQPRLNNKPLHLLFQEAVDLSQNTQTYTHVDSQSSQVKEQLLELEKEVRDLKKSDPISDQVNQNVQSVEPEKCKSLSGLFAIGKRAQNLQVERNTADDPRVSIGAKTAVKLQVERKRAEEEPRVSFGGKTAVKLQVQRKRAEEPRIFKELSDDMRMFLTHLYKEGYFRDANFLTRDKLDFDCFNDSYARDFIKFAAKKFGQDNQEIAKWLSGSDLKKVALFGCPSLGTKNVQSSKRLRRFFEIKEDTVCSKCVLKHSCHLVNQIVKKDSETLNLADVMKIITIYALEASHPELTVPEEIKASVSRLLREILKLSQTTS